MANYARNHVCFLFSARVHYQPILLLGMRKLIWWALPPKVYELETALPPFHSRPLATKTTPMLYSRVFPVVDPMPSVASHHAPTSTPLVCKIMWNKKTQRSTMIMCNLLFQGARASTCTHFKWVSHHKCKLEMQHYFLIVFVTRACASFTRYI